MRNSKFEVFYNPGLKKDLKSLGKKETATFFYIVKTTILNAPLKGKKLKGEFSGLYRFRFGDYRIIYEIDFFKKHIYILRVSHRKDVYNSLI